MASQNCPKCFSNRVRRGYRPTPFWLKILFRYNLLCDNCNWEFRGWAIPGTVSTKPTKKKKNPGGKTTESLVDKGSHKSFTNLQKETSESENGSVKLPNDSKEATVSFDNLAGQGLENIKARKKGQK